MSHDPTEVPTKPLDSLQSAARVGSKTGRTDYVRMNSQAELLVWCEAMEKLVFACETAMDFIDENCVDCSGYDDMRDELVIALAKARGEATST